MKTVYLFIGQLFISGLFFAQNPATSADEIQKALEVKSTMENESSVRAVPFENIGPTIMSGRVVDVDVNPQDPTEFYVAYATGGLWHTVNNGISFTSVFDQAPTQNIGDIAVNWKENIIWVGTGENNSSRSSYAGVGILKSTDGGKNWTFAGLPDSHHIGRIILNPNNSEEVVVGVAGHLYSPNSERGIFKSTDGGKTWKQALFIDENTGVIDVAFAPENFNIQYAAAWQKDRKAWHFEGSGPSSGIYKSTDGGNTWVKVSIEKSGFPVGKGVGRIGLAVFDENTVYAVHDSQFHRSEQSKKEDSDALTKEDFKTMSAVAFEQLDNKKLNQYLRSNGFQEKYRAENVKQLVSDGKVQPADLAKYLEDANAMLFDTPVIGAEVYLTKDGGVSWIKTHQDYIDDLYYSYGYYFGQISVHPKDLNQIYLSGVPIIKSEDGGKTFKSIGKENVHADHHALWINPNRQGHLINGNDGGLNITYDDGKNWFKANDPPVGQYYYINVDNQKNYYVYGGLQDNGVWVGPNNYRFSKNWQAEGKYPYEEIMGGDGMQVQIDSRDPNLVYTGFQFGNYFRIDRSKNQTQTQRITPKHDLGESPYRFNWQTPILLSIHNQDILYFGSNHLHRSLDKGETWSPISPNLTQGGREGNVAYGTLTTISESPFQFGMIYVGSDDGLVHLTENGGGSWQNLSQAFPENLWVSRVVASQHQKDRVYVTLNGYRSDDFTPYVYVSQDKGKTWKNITGNLPVSPINVIKEDPQTPELVYVGNDNGVFVSFDSGQRWESFAQGLPRVAVHDLVVQAETSDLLIGTHGRSIYKANIKPLQKFSKQKSKNSLLLFAPESQRASPRWGNSFGVWSEPFEPQTQWVFYSPKQGDFNVSVTDEKGRKVHQFSGKAQKGFNYVDYDFTVDASLFTNKNTEPFKKAKNGKMYLVKGNYTVEVSMNDQKSNQKLEVK